jgi:protein-disulfide isomerase
VEKDLADGEAAGVYGTPAFYINGKQYNGEVTLAALKPILGQSSRAKQNQAVAAK